MLPDVFNNSFYSKQEKHTFWRYSFSSLFAHIITRTILAPVERLKIIMQTQSIMKLLEHQKYKSYSSAIRSIFSEQGFLSFWRGNATNLYRVLPTNWVKFATYLHFKEEIFPKGQARYQGWDLISRSFACGMSSVFLIQLFVYPFDTIRTRQICDLSKLNETRMYNGAFDTMKKLLRNEGYQSLYQGYWVSYVCYAPYLALAYVFYEHIRSLFHPSIPLSQQPQQTLFFKLLGAGGIAAASSSLITYPLDTIRRRIMVNGGLGFEKEYTGMLNCIIKIAQKEGIKGFYAGFYANLVKVVPALGFQFSIYDNTRVLIFE